MAAVFEVDVLMTVTTLGSTSVAGASTEVSAGFAAVSDLVDSVQAGGLFVGDGTRDVLLFGEILKHLQGLAVSHIVVG